MYAVTSREFSEFRQPLNLQLHFIAPLQVSAPNGRHRTSIAWGLQALAKLTPPGWRSVIVERNLSKLPLESVGYQNDMRGL